MNQSINTDSKNSKEPQQKYRLGTVSIKILGGLNRFYGRPTSPSASIMDLISDFFLCQMERESKFIYQMFFLIQTVVEVKSLKLIIYHTLKVPI